MVSFTFDDNVLPGAILPESIFRPYPGWRYRVTNRHTIVHEPATLWARLKHWLARVS